MGAELRAATRALWTLGQSITDLELRDENADDGVTAPLLVPDLRLMQGQWKIDAHSNLAAYLQRQFAVTTDKIFFAFPYNFRRDNRVAARQLKEQPDRSLWEWRNEAPDGKLIQVGHSMGGVVAWYFLECLEGWRARDAIRDNPAAPTWLAYTLYGNPAATVAPTSLPSIP